MPDSRAVIPGVAERRFRRVRAIGNALPVAGAAGFTPDVAHDSVSWDATIALIAHGLGVALVPPAGPGAGERRRGPAALRRRAAAQAPHRHPGRRPHRSAVAAALDELDRLVPALLAI